jgi:nitrite reductase/ring-hydroxylating ferredoxin subunit
VASQRHDLCGLERIPDPGSRGFDIDNGGELPERIFVVRKGEVIAAYRNRCPHTGAPLEWQPDQFLDIDDCFIQCAIHGALFRAEDGYCVRGPCAGDRLQALDLELVDDRLVVWLPGP